MTATGSDIFGAIVLPSAARVCTHDSCFARMGSLLCLTHLPVSLQADALILHGSGISFSPLLSDRPVRVSSSSGNTGCHEGPHVPSFTSVTHTLAERPCGPDAGTGWQPAHCGPRSVSHSFFRDPSHVLGSFLDGQKYPTEAFVVGSGGVF